MGNDIAKLLDVKLEYIESTYGNSILDLQSGKIDVGFASPTPQRALVVDFCGAVFHIPLAPCSRRDWSQDWADINKPSVTSRSMSAPPTRQSRAVSAQCDDQVAQVRATRSC